MQFIRKREKQRTVRLEGGRRADLYPHSLQFYNIPPTENISLQEFEDFAIERLKVLKVVETVGIRFVKGSAEYRDALLKELNQLCKKQGILRGVLRKTVEDKLDNEAYDDRRKDHVSHFILRLAYCRSEELRRWFVAQELDLFRFRFFQESNASIEKFLDLNNLNYRPIPDDEKQEILKQLIESTYKSSASQINTTDFYKVPFQEALDLVRGRKVYLSRGYAYVPHSELVVIVLSHFRAQLSKALAVTSRALPHLEEDDRLLPMLSSLSKRYLGQDYSNKKPVAGKITAEMVDSLSKKSFPPCMQHLHQSMRQNHHLRHWGRQQYGLFLKAIGVPLDEAMKFWRTEFTKLVDSDKFDKQYSYNIRHNYGKEGKRTNYTPYSCIKIITSNAPGPGDHHGCPFRHTDIDLLKQKLQNLGISKDGCDKVADSARAGHYQVACAHYFELTHANATPDSISISHPNQYFEESQKHISGKKITEATPSSQRGTPVRVKASQSQSTPSQNKTKTEDEDFEDFPMSVEDMERCFQDVPECN